MKKNFKRIFMLGLVALCCVSCSKELLDNLTSDKTVQALKSALNIGIQKSVEVLSAKDGYLADNAVKILLPEEANNTFGAIDALAGTSASSTILKAVSMDPEFQDTLVVLMNRAAEDAAPKALDVFTSAITSITIADGEGILFGSNNAATQYLSDKTYTGLQSAFEPSITSSLDRVSLGGYTANSAWAFFAEQNNTLAEYINQYSSVVNLLIVTSVISTQQKNKILAVKPVSTNLANYVTGKALDGLFLKVAGEENKIRTDASARTNSLLQEVFGRLD